MATRADRFKADEARAHQKPAAKKQVARVHRVTDPLHTDTRHVTKRGDKAVGVALEDSMTGKPSRKSTRGSSNHGRSDTKLMRAALEKSESPKAVATRAKSARR